MKGTVVSTEETQGAFILRIKGRLQLDRLEPLRAELSRVWRAQPARVILDFSGCPFVDTAGIAVVVAAYKRASEANVAFFLAGVGDQFLNALRLTRLHEIFKIRDSVEAAIAG